MLLNILLAFLGIFTAGLIIFLVRRNLLHLSYTIFWFVIALIIFILGLFPGLNIQIARTLGIQYAPIRPVLLAILLLFIKSLKQDIEITRKEKQIRRLIQELSILKSKIKDE